MNKRIQKLAEQCEVRFVSNKEIFFDREKFALLIVQESKQLLLDMINSEQGNFDTLDLALTKINEHFGVEE